MDIGGSCRTWKSVGGDDDHDDHIIVYGDHHDEDCYNDDNWIAPDRSHREEFASLVLRGDVQEGTSADNAMFPGEDPFLFVLLLTFFLVCSIFTLKVIIALELLLHTNILPGKLPISRRAHHLLLLTVSTSWRLVGLVTFTATTP